jgi:hypothetical protein
MRENVSAAAGPQCRSAECGRAPPSAARPTPRPPRPPPGPGPLCCLTRRPRRRRRRIQSGSPPRRRPKPRPTAPATARARRLLRCGREPCEASAALPTRCAQAFCAACAVTHAPAWPRIDARPRRAAAAAAARAERRCSGGVAAPSSVLLLQEPLLYSGYIENVQGMAMGATRGRGVFSPPWPQRVCTLQRKRQPGALSRSSRIAKRQCGGLQPSFKTKIP